MTTQPRVYLAGPITGLTFSDAQHGWRKKICDLLPNGWRLFSPLRGKDHLATQGVLNSSAYDVHPTSTNQGVLGRDRNDTKNADLPTGAVELRIDACEVLGTTEPLPLEVNSDRDYGEEILNAAKEFDADMIVIGSRGLGLLKSNVLGSVSQKVLHHAGCSVVTVR